MMAGAIGAGLRTSREMKAATEQNMALRQMVVLRTEEMELCEVVQAVGAITDHKCSFEKARAWSSWGLQISLLQNLHLINKRKSLEFILVSLQNHNCSVSMKDIFCYAKGIAVQEKPGPCGKTD